MVGGCDVGGNNFNLVRYLESNYYQEMKSQIPHQRKKIEIDVILPMQSTM